MKLLKESSLSLEDNVLIKTALKACKDQINEGNWQSVYDYADGLVEKDALRLYDMITFYLVKLGIDPIEANKDWILSDDFYDAFDYPEWDMEPYGSIVFTDKTRLHSLLRSRNIDLRIYYSLDDYKDPSSLRIISSRDGFSDRDNWFLSDNSWNSGRSLATYEAHLLVKYAKEDKIYDLGIKEFSQKKIWIMQGWWNMTREFAKEWLNNLKEYWFNKDIKSAVSLFKDTTFYQETPFMKPYTTIEEINQEWQHVMDENI